MYTDALNGNISDWKPKVKFESSSRIMDKRSKFVESY